ncbi:MAG TPA: NAGSA dehydrogenase family protein [Streptosporangiaceae bacterium]
MGARVAVAGASGYAGGELLRLLAGHPDLEIGAVTADSKAGRPVADVHPQLAGVPALADRVFSSAADTTLAGHDLAFLALPAGQSAPVAAALDGDVRVVDLGPDFRLADSQAWARHYQGGHAGRWPCGLPELPGGRAQLRTATRAAVPGCYATAAILALTPVIRAGLAEPGDIVVVAASGTSGAGRSPREELLATEVMGATSAYQAGGSHRHIAEIEQAIAEALAASERTDGQQAAGQPASGQQASGHPTAGEQVAGQQVADQQVADQEAAGQRVSVSFTPLLVPMPRGILATCTARLAGEAAGQSAKVATALLRAALSAGYPAEPFVTVLPEGRWPGTAAVAGSNAVHLQAAADERAGRAVIVAAIDNLGKGAAGQALQTANLMLGLPEGAGLTACGVAP